MGKRAESSEASGNSHVPASVVRRFPRYLAYVQRLCERDVDWVSSQELAEALGLTSSTVRQDLSHIDFSGISKRGYSTEGMARVLGTLLGAGEETRAVIVGAGNLGRALAQHGELTARGFRICAIFDVDPQVIGRQVGGATVQSMRDLARVVAESGAQIGIIAVPAAAAQNVADRLILAGIRGLLNLAHVHLHAPASVSVVDARITARLQELVYAIRAKSCRSADRTPR